MRRAVAVLLATLTSGALGCGRSEGIPDEKLGGLVIAPKEKADPIDIARAAKDSRELSRALALPYRDVIAAIGPHTYSISTATTVEEAGKKVNDLSDITKIEIGDKAAFEALYNNSADYGRE